MNIIINSDNSGLIFIEGIQNKEIVEAIQQTHLKLRRYWTVLNELKENNPFYLSGRYPVAFILYYIKCYFEELLKVF